MTVKRKLTTIMCADVVGYSRLMGVDEPGTLKRLKGCRELMAQFIERHHGRVISWTGDAVLAEFSSVVEGVQCAIEVQRDLRARNDGMKPDDRMEFRIGLNLGDVMVEEHDIFGEGVNIAARLQSIAPKGGILISGSVYEQVRNKLTVGFNFMGHQQVKNIADHVPAYVVRHDGSAEPAIGVHALKGGPAAEGALKNGMRVRGGHPVPGASPVARMAAAGVDWAAALAATLVLGLAVETAAPNTFDLSPVFSSLASDRVIATEEPATEILDGGALVIVKEPKIVERSFMGFAVQTLRVTHAEIQETATGGGTAAKPIKRSAAVESHIDPKTREALALPALIWALPLLYLAIVAGFEGLGRNAASPGKQLLGLKVARSNGRDSGLFTALIRNAAKIVAALPLFAGFLMALWTRQRQGLHDWFADAVVTRK